MPSSCYKLYIMRCLNLFKSIFALNIYIATSLYKIELYTYYLKSLSLQNIMFFNFLK